MSESAETPSPSTASETTASETTASEGADPQLLEGVTEKLGAVLGPLDHHLLGDEEDPSPRVPLRFGDPRAERRALLEGAALVDLSHLELLEMSGEDRRRFLNGQLTCEVAELDSGGSAYGFFVSQKGKVQADVTVLALEERFLLLLPPGRGEPVREHLAKYILVDRVELGDPALVPVAVTGPEAWAALEALGFTGLPTAEGSHAPVVVPGELLGEERGPASVQALRRRLHGVPALWLVLPRAVAARVFDRLARRGGEHGLAPAGWEALETVRVERGVPRFGADFGPGHFPQESGLEEAVSYTKGCYLGQEVVARIHYRGGVNRHLRGLVFGDVSGGPGSELPQPGTEVLLEGRSVGSVGTAVESPELGVVGLAVLHQRAEPGVEVELEGGDGEGAVTARVLELPFEGSES